MTVYYLRLKRKWSRSVVSSSLGPYTVAYQAPLSMGVFQARILEWVAIFFTRGSSRPRDGSRSPILQATREAHLLLYPSWVTPVWFFSLPIPLVSFFLSFVWATRLAVSSTRHWTHAPIVEELSLNHRTSGAVPPLVFSDDSSAKKKLLGNQRRNFKALFLSDLEGQCIRKYLTPAEGYWTK